MKRLFVFLTALSVFFSCSADKEVRSARELARRILPAQAANIEFVREAADTDFYALRARDGKLTITANNANSMAVGLNNYLKDFCQVTVSWYAEDEVPQPAVLPDTPGQIRRKAVSKNRFFLNYCTFGYTMNWWTWEQWERLIDWMAMNGVTMALANTGQEAVWQRVWRKHGMSDEQIRAYFTGPSFLAWHRMVNIDKWSGPLPQSWIDAQVELQQKIIARETSLGIAPILSAFTGHVPQQLREIYPEADIRKLSDWAHFGEEYNCWYLNPVEPLFQQIAGEFLAEQKALFGQATHIYGIDLFNEIIPPSWEKDYLSRVTALTWKSLTESDPDAVWLQMAWTFYHHRKWWTPDIIEAYLSPVPKGRMLMLDYYCEHKEIYPATDAFFGHDYIWSYLGNFGGNTGILGDFKEVESRIDRVLAEGGDNFTGFGCTLEGFSVNPYAYEYVLDRAWEKDRSLDEWWENLADCRTGLTDTLSRAAWKILAEKVYVGPTYFGGSPMTARPEVAPKKRLQRCPFNPLAYDNADLMQAWQSLTARELSFTPAYRFDCVNLGRQWMENRFTQDYEDWREAFAKKNLREIRRLSAEMLELFDDVDSLICTQHYYLTGKWIQEARRWGADEAEADYFEGDARRIISTWGFRDHHLVNYASRTWNGLLGDYYRPLWAEMFRRAEEALRSGKAFDEPAFRDWATEQEWAWTSARQSYLAAPVGDSYAVSAALCAKWSAR